MSEQFDPNATGRFYVTRERPVGNFVREQADVIAEHESLRHPRSTVKVIDAATGELVAIWGNGVESRIDSEPSETNPLRGLIVAFDAERMRIEASHR